MEPTKDTRTGRRQIAFSAGIIAMIDRFRLRYHVQHGIKINRTTAGELLMREALAAQGYPTDIEGNPLPSKGEPEISGQTTIDPNAESGE